MRVIQWKGPRAPRRGYGVDTRPQVFSVSVGSCRIGQTAAVTIRGANFRNCPLGTPPQVTFGGLAATSVVVVDNSTITCVSPVAVDAGTVDVAVTTGCC